MVLNEQFPRLLINLLPFLLRGPVIPEGSLLTNDGDPILTNDGNFIIANE